MSPELLDLLERALSIILESDPDEHGDWIEETREALRLAGSRSTDL